MQQTAIYTDFFNITPSIYPIIFPRIIQPTLYETEFYLIKYSLGTFLVIICQLSYLKSFTKPDVNFMYW